NLQDKMTPFPQAEAERMIESNIGRPVLDLFSTFGPAVAAASIAQVHRATVAEDGRMVAVKVLRPGIGRRLHGRPKGRLLFRSPGRAVFARGAPAAAG